MYAIELTIGEYVHRLPRAADEAAVLAELTDAVRAGGGVVTLPTSAAGSAVSILISPGVLVLIERTLVPDDEGSDPFGPDDFTHDNWPAAEGF
ncbi:hypothetical protein [Microbacterium kyungheense]|uniref:hypothetical protein n=1 Tax=Microbacterium kyungheense TaxID=1263636 RepID=UPI0011546058|nr:hypothetical protein [Microbacterium kyungheense]